MLLFVGFCVIHRYWPLVVSFAPLCKQGYLLHLVAIVTFCCTAQNTFVLRVFCAVQPKCHTDNVAWLLDLSGTAQEEILLPIRVGKFGSDLLLVSCLNSASWEVSTSLLSHWRRSLSITEPSDEGEERVDEKQKSTPGAVKKHWNCDDTSNDIVLHLNLLLWLERAIVFPLIWCHS